MDRFSLPGWFCKAREIASTCEGPECSAGRSVAAAAADGQVSLTRVVLLAYEMASRLARGRTAVRDAVSPRLRPMDGVSSRRFVAERLSGGEGGAGVGAAWLAAG